MTKRKFSDKKLGRPVKGVTWKNDPERVIVAKFAGYCSECFGDIEVGEWVFWSSDSKELRHQKCDPEPEREAVRPERGWRITPSDRPSHTRTPVDSDPPAHADGVRPADRCSHWDRLVQEGP